MMELNKPKRLKHYLIIFVCILFMAVSLYGVWLLFPVSLDKSIAVTQVSETKKPIINAKSGLVLEPPVISIKPELPPDYSLPTGLNGMAPVVYRVATDQNIVFLGIDDGSFKDQSVVDVMQENNIKASLFLTKSAILNNPDFFKQLINLGSFVENHTLNHDTKMTTSENYDQQKADICGMADYEELHFGRRPTLFRPPGGAYSDTMRQAATDCGMKAVVTWVAKANGGSMQYQIGNKLRPGDVVLMHFRPEFKQDMKAFVDAMNVAGLHTALLEDAL